jgi:two-component system, cell cycle response regulator
VDDERARAASVVAVAADIAADVQPVLEADGFSVVVVEDVDDVAVRGEGAPVAAVVGWPVQRVGLGELGVPVVVRVPDDEVEAAVVDAMRRGAHDVVRASATAGEVVLRVRAAERTALVLRQLQARAQVDPLTALGNRRYVDEHLDIMSAMARRQRSPFSLLLIDVDRVRRINEEHGHAAGDAVLIEVSQRIVAGLRAEDVAGRWSGEEFVVLLPHTALDGAWRLAERIRASVCDEPVDLGGGNDVMVTVSVGCAEGIGDDVEDHLRRAQAAVDEAKAEGRNKVVADTSPVPG